MRFVRLLASDAGVPLYTRTVTLLCVPIMVRDPDAALALAHEAKAAGAGMVEYRVDEFFNPGAPEADPSRQQREITRLVSQSPLPCILTCRSATEGGGYEGDEGERASLYEKTSSPGAKDQLPPRYLDIELASYAGDADIRDSLNRAIDHPARKRADAPGLILSAHDFQSRPADLTRKLLAMQAEPAANVLKIAYRARSLRDNLELFEILSHADRPMIALAMGEFGLMSRVLAPKFSAFLTFASLRPESVTAPGQPTVSELRDLYRFRSIGSKTKVYGVIGWPVGHSMSPLVHNAVFNAHEFDGVYLPLPVHASDDAEANYASFKATVGALVDDPRLDFSGASVTIPHKENLFRYARERGWTVDSLCEAVGAANTLSIERTASGSPKKIRITNTDVEACVAPLRAALGTLEGRTIAIVGAGGAARAAAFGFANSGAEVIVFNRNLDRAERLAAEVSEWGKGGSVAASSHDKLPSEPADAYVNATPVGMAGGPDPQGFAIPIDRIVSPGNTRPSPVVLDTVYNPIETPLVLAAKAKGWTVIDGVTMFVGQAAAQSEGWIGRPAPRDLMDRLVRERLDSANRTS